jgi:hypothetical protein
VSVFKRENEMKPPQNPSPTLYSSGTRTATATAAADGESTRGDAAGCFGEKQNAEGERTRSVRGFDGEAGSVGAGGGGGASKIEGQRRDEYDPMRRKEVGVRWLRTAGVN